MNCQHSQKSRPKTRLERLLQVFGLVETSYLALVKSLVQKLNEPVVTGRQVITASRSLLRGGECAGLFYCLLPNEGPDSLVKFFVLLNIEGVAAINFYYLCLRKMKAKMMFGADSIIFFAGHN